MTWIKQNTFLFGLLVTTVVGALVLWFLGSSAAGRYEDAKNEYESAFAEVSRFEKLDPYPTTEHLEAKKVAIEEYREGAIELQKSFEPYRPESTENISPQAFSSAVKRANEETRAAFGKDVALPENYYCGFEAYLNALPTGNSTGVLNYQLSVIKQLMLNLSESGATRLISIHRPRLPEEEGKAFKPEKKQIARELPLEIVFEGTEASARDFLSTLVNDKERYLVVRSLRIINKKAQPPRKTDAKFSDRGGRRQVNKPVEDAPNFNDLFNGGGEPQPEGEQPEGEQPEGEQPEGGEAAQPAQPEQPAFAPGDNSRILAQVLGKEEIQVFVRFDLLLFLDSKELP